VWHYLHSGDTQYALISDILPRRVAVYRNTRNPVVSTLENTAVRYTTTTQNYPLNITRERVLAWWDAPSAHSN